jgi:hypothetical protein
MFDSGIRTAVDKSTPARYWQHTKPIRVARNIAVPNIAVPNIAVPGNASPTCCTDVVASNKQAANMPSN